MNEKLISEFLQLGCPNERNAYITLQVYLELCEVKKYWDVEYGFNSVLGRMYVTGKKTKAGPKIIFLPAASNEELDFLNLQMMLTASEDEQKSVCIVFVASDSTCVYYQITKDLEQPRERDSSARENKQKKLDAVLRRNRNLLEQSALYGIPITIINKKGSHSGKTK